MTTFALLSGMLFVPGQAASDVYGVPQRDIEIPINFEEGRRNEIRELLLYVSKNQGESWEIADRKMPNQTVFKYLALEDGVYWFSMMIIDKKGQKDPADINSTPPGMKVLIDTKLPVVNIKSAERTGDDVTVTWDVQEAHPNLSTMKLEYKGSDGKWYRSEIQPVIAGSARIPRGVQMGVTQVRLEVADLAKNRGEGIKDVVDGTPLVNPVVSKSDTSSGTGSNNSTTLSPVSNNSLVPALPSVNPSDTGVKTPTVIAESNNKVPPPTPDLKETKNEVPPPLAVVERTLPEAQPIAVSRFTIGFTSDQTGPSGVSKAQLWVTRDDGKTWKMWKEYDRADSEITADLDVKGNSQVEGIYGFKIVLVSGAGLSKGEPKGGDLPDMRVDLDLSAPEIQMYEPLPDPKEKDTLVLRWKAFDRNMSSNPITLEWSERKDGPWHPIAGTDSKEAETNSPKRLANVGSHTWKLPNGIPARVFLKISARDTAGNIADAITPSTVLVDMSRPEAKIQGIIGTGSTTQSTSAKREK
jgi:hypothetical protein